MKRKLIIMLLGIILLSTVAYAGITGLIAKDEVYDIKVSKELSNFAKTNIRNVYWGKDLVEKEKYTYGVLHYDALDKGVWIKRTKAFIVYDYADNKTDVELLIKTRMSESVVGVLQKEYDSSNPKTSTKLNIGIKNITISEVK